MFHVVLPLKYMFLFGLEPIKQRIRKERSMYFPDKIMRYFILCLLSGLRDIMEIRKYDGRTDDILVDRPTQLVCIWIFIC